ncbi:MAG: tetratricopeptide repeat protein [Candidatus Gastranaerophilales bacterium]|nr:tetratricopeptide repeat protein [Candidatus Gastranaerophilales bacterium]
MKKNYAVAALLICLNIASLPAFSYEYVQSYNDNINHYDAGMEFIQNREYTKAIESLTKALKQNPSEPSVRNNLCVAYTSRGTYYYNQGTDLEKAANDYRSAIYYLKYYGNYENSPTINENIKIAEQNLASVMQVQKASLSPQARLKKAKELRGKGELIPAVVEYAAAAQDRNFAYESYVSMGDITKILGDNYNAAVYYDKALAIDLKDPNTHLKFARVLLALGKIDLAVKEFDIAMENPSTKDDALAQLEAIWSEKVRQNPKDPVAQMNLGAVYQEKGLLDKALNQYKLAQTIDPQNQMIRLNMATLYQQQGNLQDALAIYDSVLKANPNDVLANSYKASALRKSGQKAGAIDIYKTLLASNPNNSQIKEDIITTIKEMPTEAALNNMYDLAAKNPNDYTIQYEFAYMLHQNKRYNEALSYYQKALRLNNKSADAYLNIAAIYKSQNNTAKAIEELQTAKSVLPSDKRIVQMLEDFNAEVSFSKMDKAAELYDKKQYQEAIDIYRSISEPTEDVYLGIGACYQAMEKYDDAIANYLKVAAMDPSNPNAHYFLGLAYYYKKDYAKAEASLKKAASLDNINPDIQDALKTVKFAQSEEKMNKAVELFDKNSYTEALTMLNAAITLSPENGYAYYYRGMVYDVQSKPAQAITDYKKAVSLIPDLHMAYYSIALDYDALKNYVEAKKMYQKFVELSGNSNDEYVKYAKQRLSQIK